MKRLLMYASPVIGVLLGMAGIMVFRQQPPAEAVAPAASLDVPGTATPDARGLREFRWPSLSETLAPRREGLAEGAEQLPDVTSQPGLQDKIITTAKP